MYVHIEIRQQEGDEWRPVMHASMALNGTEKRYAQIEKEALAITWACEKFHNHILGENVTILRDHKPLVPLLQSKPLADLTARFQRLRMRLI
ncbi:hypothetical protein PR048_032920 [Dryococelus australis]|uniref:Reverse transcriptase RNase H-like domain-containing protein n=1 Tax=Dryococelus australis TaxID=614101 RepID=A0ABQ9G6R6_9NEOP|nr:hypothetical protein PR048_032920 [Dryococelus australis]